jgi:DNA-binding NtrC family response regulator
MEALLVFVQTQDPAFEALVKEVSSDEGHSVKSFRTYNELLAGIERYPSPDILLLSAEQLRGPEMGAYGALLRSQPTMQVALVASPGERYPVLGLEALDELQVLTRPVLRRDLERLIEDSQRMKRPILAPGLAEKAAPRLVPSRVCAQPSRSGPILEELDDSRFFLAFSPAMLEIYRQVKLLQDIDVSVLILGESGTGKEIVANLIHKHSRRARQRFVNVNCAALPMDLLESELFGYVKGAFTGAVTDKPGWFEQANEGTILLDEVGEISAAMQAKLLHVLQDGQFTRLGARNPTNVNVHVLAATNIAIEQALAAKTFREDFYYRLNAFTINVPRLRERTVEIPYLVKEMIARTPLARNAGVTEFPREIMELLPHYSWPGNLRELRHFVLRTIIMRDENAARVDLESKIEMSRRVNKTNALVEPLQRDVHMRSVVRDVRDRTEKRMIEEALQASGWNRRDAATSLNISYRALLYKIQQYDLNPRRQKLAG